MNDLDRARRVNALLMDALALPEADRGRFLREQCGDDEKLVAQVTRLLAGAGSAQQFFDRLGGEVGDLLGQTSDDASTSSASDKAEPVDLRIGARVGHFRVDGVLGKGGMGTVYRATDLRLAREVALKALPAEVARGSEQEERFEQEARLLAALSHPNIAAIYGTHQEGDRRFLVLEMVDGPGLDQHIARRRPTIAESLEIAAQMARALEVAHRAGIIHRDLKPANVKIESQSRIVKVLDFGIATVLPQFATDVRSDAARKLVSTDAGRVLGTVAYMSPEQARGDAVDERSDLWSWGCVLFEMLSGQRAFHGRTATDTLAAIIEREPDWSLLPGATPDEVVRVLQRCLRKDARRRLRNAGDVWLVLEDVLNPLTSGEIAALPPESRSLGRRAAPWIVGIAALLVGLMLGGGLDPGTDEPTRRLEMLLQGEQVRTAVGGRALAISPDGSTVVHNAEGRLHLRRMDEFEDRMLSGSIGAESPTFSPDGQWLAFFARGMVRKLAVGGGEPFPLCAAAIPRGIDWGSDDRIVFSDGASLWTVDVEGARCERVAGPDSDDEATRWIWPSWLPGGSRVLFQRSGGSENGVAVLDLETGETTQLTSSGSDPRYARSGHLLFSQLGTVFAAPLDAGALTLGSVPTPVLEGVATESTGATHLALSPDGVLAYLPRRGPERELVWVDLDGGVELASETRADFSTPRVSPDGSRVAVVIRRAGERQIWVYERATDAARQLTHGGDTGIWPAWTPDGTRVSFASGRDGPSRIWWQNANGAGDAELLTLDGRFQYVGSWARRAPVLTWFQVGPSGTRDVWVQLVGEPSRAFAVVATEAHEQGPALSPDARWIAYVSNESGRNEVYLQACPACAPGSAAPDGERAPRWILSRDGGGEPLWAPDGDRIYYREGTRLMVVSLSAATGTPQPTAPELVLDGPYAFDDSGNQSYDIAPDGHRFLLVRNLDDGGPERIRVVLNWFAELR